MLMMKMLLGVALFAVVANCEGKSTIYDEQVVEGRSAMRGPPGSIRSLIECGFSDVQCLLERGEDFLEVRRKRLLDEADQEAVSMRSARKKSDDDDSSLPSELTDSVAHMFTEIGDIVKGGWSGLFRDVDAGEEDEESTLSAGDDDELVDPQQGVLQDEYKDDTSLSDDGTSRGLYGDERGKKKKKRKALMKLLLLGLALKAKLGMLLQLLSAKLQIKFFFIALAGLLINAARFYVDLKKSHQPQKVIYYEHAQHQHHYDGGDDDHGYWGRSYVLQDKAQANEAPELAYAAQHQPHWGSTL